MAILVEEKKKGVSWLFIGIILGVFVGLSVLMYFVFFAAAPLIENVATPSNYDSTSKLSKVNIDIDSVTTSPVWTSLSSGNVPTIVVPDTIAPKKNPFEASF